MDAPGLVPSELKEGRVYTFKVRYAHGPKLYDLEMRGVFTGVDEYGCAGLKFPGTPTRLALPNVMIYDIQEARNKPTFLPRRATA